MITATALIEKFQYALDNKWGYIWGKAGITWTAEKQAEIEKTTDSKYAQARLYGKKWIGHKVADCSGLFTWAFRQLGGEMYHGSNTMYLKWCRDKGTMKKGTRTDGKALKPGTAVFVYDGQTYSHVGLFIGNNTVIEAQGTRAGVTTSKASDSKWTYWGELNGVGYESTFPVTEPTPEPEVKLPTLRKGSKGEYVVLLQNMLVKLGYFLGPYGVDGDFGKQTEKAVKEFQEKNKDADGKPLEVDGVVGKKTWAALEKAVGTGTVPVVKKYTVHIPGLTAEQADAVIRQYTGSYKTEE